jgi:polyhydroxyalkanoate synthesis regulator phasin
MALPERSTEEILQEMEPQKIITLADIYRALKKHPEWLQEIRRLILTEELMELPRKFDEFVEKEFKPLKQDVDTLKKDVDTLKQDVEILKQDVEILKQDVKVLKDDVAMLKGDMLELKVRNKIGAYLGKLLYKARVIETGDFADTLYEAIEKNLISEEEADYALEIHIAAEGYLRRNKEKKILIALEVSNVVDRGDVERASERANIISRVYGMECIPAVLGRKITEDAKERAEELAVLLI